MTANGNARGKTANTDTDNEKEQQQQQQQPFFAAVGIHKPHLPWGVPERYFKEYPPASEIKLAEFPLEPVRLHLFLWGVCFLNRQGTGDLEVLGNTACLNGVPTRAALH